MPRTKLPKTSSSKKNQDQSQEEIHSFDEDVNNQITDFEYKHNQYLNVIESTFRKFISNIPDNVLSMTMGELQGTNVAAFSDVSKIVDTNQTEVTTSTAQLYRSQNQSKSDEGYITEARTSEQGGGSSTSSSSVLVGPLASAARRKQQNRRSKSAPNQSASRPPIPSRLKQPTPMKAKTPATGEFPQQAQHTSRSAYRTPLQHQQRTKAASADRAGNITPKMPVDKPVALLRFPKLGETLISLTGSPVTGVAPGSYEASVNIPTATGNMLSLRPTPGAYFDANMLGDIDEDTLNHLKQLQANLNTVMKLTQQKK